MEQYLDYILVHFGYLGIILLLVGGIVGLPIPDEVLLTYVGFNVFQGKLLYIPSILSAFVGATGGISLSYFIGYKFGVPLVKKYGSTIHITEEKLEKTNKLFVKIGPFFIFFGYFIPGLRHLTAYISAIDRFPFRKFIVYAYPGAMFWVITFITLGRELGTEWKLIGFYILKYRILFIVLVTSIVSVWYLFGKKRNRE